MKIPRINLADRGLLAELRRLRAVVLLSGSPWPTPFASGVGRSLLDLPIDGAHSLMHLWNEQVESLAERLSAQHLPVRVLLCRNAAIPTAHKNGRARVQVERDRSDYRGTGGLLRDIAEPYADDDLILVASAAQLLLGSLADAVRVMGEGGAGVVLMAQPDGTAGGLMLLRCGALRSISPIGFVDFKEQALPSIQRGCKVIAASDLPIVSLPVRTADDYLSAVRRYTRAAAAMVEMPPDPTRPPAVPFADCHDGTFAIREAGCRVDGTAALLDSVALRDSRVGAGAVLIRSVVCGGARVAPGQVVRDQVLFGHGG